jgi:hypothetical protein
MSILKTKKQGKYPLKSELINGKLVKGRKTSFRLP